MPHPSSDGRGATGLPINYDYQRADEKVGITLLGWVIAIIFFVPNLVFHLSRAGGVQDRVFPDTEDAIDFALDALDENDAVGLFLLCPSRYGRQARTDFPPLTTTAVPVPIGLPSPPMLARNGVGLIVMPAPETIVAVPIDVATIMVVAAVPVGVTIVGATADIDPDVSSSLQIRASK
jgi:hypothetical protein